MIESLASWEFHNNDEKDAVNAISTISLETNFNLLLNSQSLDKEVCSHICTVISQFVLQSGRVVCDIHIGVVNNTYKII